MFLPRALSALPDASSALQRLSHIFHAELRGDGNPVIDATQEYAIDVRDATFEWESPKTADKQSSSHSVIPDHGLEAKGDSRETDLEKDDESDTTRMPGDGPVFRVSDVTLTVPRGQLAAIVGPVGSGKVCFHFSYIDDAWSLDLRIYIV